MKHKIIFLVFSLFFINCESNSSYPWILDQSYNEILKSAGDKLVLLDFETDWWSWCDRLDADTYSDKNVQSFAKKNFLSLKIDAEKGEGIALAKKYAVRGYPTIIIVDGKGNELDRIGGYLPPEPFLEELKRIQQGKNTLPVMIQEYEANPNTFSLAYALAEKYESMGDMLSAKKMIQTILDEKIDSLGMAQFKSILYEARVNKDASILIAFADQNPEYSQWNAALSNAKNIVRQAGDNPQLEADLFLRLIQKVENPRPDDLNAFAWRMTELGKNLDLALAKISLAINLETDIEKRVMEMDTKAEVLWKLGRVEDAIVEIQKCIKAKPDDSYYQAQLAKFKK